MTILHKKRKGGLHCRKLLYKMDKIKQIIEEEGMDEHDNIYLYIVGKTLNDAKVSL